MMARFASGDPLGLGACGLAALALVAVTAWHWANPEVLPLARMPQASAPPPLASAAHEPPPDYLEIAHWHLFGEPASDEPTDTATAGSPDEESLENLPASTLDLQVTGIVTANHTGAARAVIMDGTGRQSENAVGDRLPGNVELHAIERGRVVIRHNGELEAIALPQPQPLVPQRPVLVPADATPLSSTN